MSSPAYQRMWRAKNRERSREFGRKWRLNNPELARARERQYNAEHREQRREYSKNYRQKNPIKVKALNLDWREKHREESRLRAKQWRRDNPEKCRAHSRSKKEFIRGNPKEAKIILQWELVWRRRGKVKCFWCGGGFLPHECHMDHIIARANGGLHAIENLCVSCADCNQKKHTSSIKDWNSKIKNPILL